MSKLKDVIAYFCLEYPHKDELSKARLTKLVYLADWRSAITNEKQVTDIKWKFNHYGPYVSDIVALARNDADFEVISSITMYGDKKEIIKVKDGYKTAFLTNEDKAILDFVISSTKEKYWVEFIKLIYSTYPILTKPRFDNLDLVELAKEYKKSHVG